MTIKRQEHEGELVVLRIPVPVELDRRIEIRAARERRRKQDVIRAALQAYCKEKA